MGRATQWFKSLFGIKKGKEKNEISNSSRVLCKNPATIPPNITAAEAAWLVSASATAVKFSSNGKEDALYVSREEDLAAVKIQRTFRGYLGRKALKGLRAVVKLQALVRGILVRKQIKTTLHSMEALIRAQNIVRAKKIRSRYQNFDHFYHNNHVQKVKGMHDDTRTEYISTPHSKRLSHSFDTKLNKKYEKPMVVEVGPARLKSRSRRSNNSVSDTSDDLLCPIRCNNRSRLSVPDSRNHHDPNWALTGNECRFSSAHSSPCFFNRTNGFSIGPYGPLTPVNYMADTQSFKAKLRCQSAPRQMPDFGLKKRRSLLELMESRNSHSGLRMQRTCSQAQDVIAFKDAVMCKLDTSCDSGRRGERTSFFGRKL